MHRDEDHQLPAEEATSDAEEARAERGRQIRAARKLLGWSRDRLASMAELTMTDLIHLERGTLGGRPKAFNTVWRVLEACGVSLVAEGGDGSPVRLKSMTPRLERQTMIDDFENSVMAYLRRIEAAIDRLSEHVDDLKGRMPSAQRELGEEKNDPVKISAGSNDPIAQVVRTRVSWDRA